MTLEEATIIANIMGTADHGCSTCVGDLLDRLEKAFPEFAFEPTDEEVEEMPDWFDPETDDREEFLRQFGMQHVGYRIEVTLKETAA